MTPDADRSLPPGTPLPRQPLGPQWLRMGKWVLKLVLVAGLLVLAVLTVVTGYEGPFSRLNDNSRAGWADLAGTTELPDGSQAVTLSSGTTLRFVEDDGTPVDESRWTDPFGGLGALRFECGPALDGTTTVTIWSSAGGYCGNGLRTWNPLRKDLDLWGRHAVLRAEIVNPAPGE